jgi:hypothetical protein
MMEPVGQSSSRDEKVRAYLRHLLEQRPESMRRPPVIGPSDGDGLYTHPEVLQHLWQDLNGALPEDCRAIVHGHAVLRHPCTGIVFAFAAGTQYVLRVPTDIRQALQPNERNDVIPSRKIDATWRKESWDLRPFLEEDWIFGQWCTEEMDWCRSGYEAAAGGGA